MIILFIYKSHKIT